MAIFKKKKQEEQVNKPHEEQTVKAAGGLELPKSWFVNLNKENEETNRKIDEKQENSNVLSTEKPTTISTIETKPIVPKAEDVVVTKQEAAAFKPVAHGNPGEVANKQLLKLQNRLIINNNANDSFLTEIYGDTTNIYDISQMFKKFPKNSLKTLLRDGLVEFPIKDSNNRYVNGFDIKTTNKFKKFKERNLNLIKDKGVNHFFLGFPFVKGLIKTKDRNHYTLANNVFYAPLLFWAITIDVDDNGIPVIKLLQEADMPICRMNSQILEKAGIVNGIKKSIDDVINVNVYDKNFGSIFNKVQEIYKTYGIILDEKDKKAFNDCVNKLNPDKFVNIDTAQYLKTSRDTTIENFSVIGIFTPSDAGLYNDYNIIIKNDGQGFLNSIKNYSYDAIQMAVDASTPFKEGNIKTITPLDFPQKKAVKVTLNENVVIQGPPGTGKSETIANIIANILFRLNSACFVVEKRTAGEVVYNRLKLLRLFCLEMFEDDNFNRDFTKQLKTNVSHINKMIERRDELLQEGGLSGADLDEIFKRVNDFNKIMGSRTGRKYPKFQMEYNLKKAELQKAINLCYAQLNRSNNAREFWNSVRKAKNDDIKFELLHRQQVADTIKLSDLEMIALFSLNKDFDGSSEFYSVVLTNFTKTYCTANKIPFDETKILENEKYKAFEKFFLTLDEQTTDAFISSNGIWYEGILNKYQLDTYKNLIMFADQYNYDNFDYNMAKSYKTMIAFANDNSDILSVDDENYYTDINEILREKYSEDLFTCEESILKNIFKVLSSDSSYYDEYNRFYAFVTSCDSVASVKETFSKYKRIISLLFPVIICSPKMVSDYVPCKRAMFDYVIFDEASQITLEKGIPILYRGVKFCITGDNRQLPPESYFQNLKVRKALQEVIVTDQKQDIEDLLIDGCVSLLDYMTKKVQSVTLNYHYRSKTADLIAFNNAAFYSNTLNVANNPKTTNSGIKVLNVKGSYKNSVNENEAKKAVQVVEEIIKDKKHGTIGIITFSKEMRDRVAELIINHPSKAVGNELYRTKANGEFEGLFIKHVNTVQGEERDNIIVCCGFSGDEYSDKVFEESIGILNTEIGKNYINVMFSRAKQNMYIIKSFMADEINSNELAEGSKYFVDYIKYAETFNQTKTIDSPEVQAIFIPYIRDEGVYDMSRDADNENVSGEESNENKIDWLTQQVSDEISKLIDTNKVEILNNHQEGLVKLNICLKLKSDDSIPMAIICNRFVKNNNLSSKERDYYAKRFLAVKNWKIWEVSSLQWCKTYRREEILKAFCEKAKKWGVPLKGNTVKVLNNPKTKAIKRLKKSKRRS